MKMIHVSFGKHDFVMPMRRLCDKWVLLIVGQFGWGHCRFIDASPQQLSLAAAPHYE
jgi:hypothetical protein